VSVLAAIDTGALLNVVALSFAATLATVVLFTSAVTLTVDGTARWRRVAAAVLLALCAALALFGLYVIFTQK
jgi:hypothetical protein